MMKLTRSQLDTLVEAIEGLTVDQRLNVKITGSPDGELRVRIADAWGYEYLGINRHGLAYREDLGDELDAATGQSRR